MLTSLQLPPGNLHSLTVRVFFWQYLFFLAMLAGFRDVFHRLSPEEEVLVMLSSRVHHTLSGDVIARAEAAVDLFARNRFVSECNHVVLERAIGLCDSLMTNIEEALQAAALADGSDGVQVSVVREAYERWQACNEVANRITTVLAECAHWSANGKRSAAGAARATSPVRPLAQISLHKGRRAKTVSARSAAREWQRLISTMSLSSATAAFERYLLALPESELEKLESELQCV
jgi:hypothetical protein